MAEERTRLTVPDVLALLVLLAFVGLACLGAADVAMWLWRHC